MNIDLSTSVTFGEIANFVAYVYAPAVLVTPLGALSIIIRYVMTFLLISDEHYLIGIFHIFSY